jgi:hypothetical protein
LFGIHILSFDQNSHQIHKWNECNKSCCCCCCCCFVIVFYSMKFMNQWINESKIRIMRINIVKFSLASNFSVNLRIVNLSDNIITNIQYFIGPFWNSLDHYLLFSSGLNRSLLTIIILNNIEFHQHLDQEEYLISCKWRFTNIQNVNNHFDEISNVNFQINDYFFKSWIFYF